MSSALYNREILALAASLAGRQRLAEPHATADRRSLVCGSRVIVDVRLDDAGKICALGLDARACALGQASAALMAAHASGHGGREMEEAASLLTAYLAGTSDDLSFWPGIAALASARDYPGRHPSILLAFEAAAAAVRQAEQGGDA